MKFIAHRGNTTGPVPALENKPTYITQALNSGFECEIDVWWRNGWWLGHDQPDYEVPTSFLLQKGLWIHAKNLEALERLLILKVNCFSHDKDDYVLTSHGYIWAYPGSPLSHQTICVMPERASYSPSEKYAALGICSDYVSLESEAFKKTKDLH